MLCGLEVSFKFLQLALNEGIKTERCQQAWNDLSVYRVKTWTNHLRLVDLIQPWHIFKYFFFLFVLQVLYSGVI